MNKENLKKTLIFLHIPKAGGTTFYGILDRNYLREKTFHFDSSNPEKSMREFKEMSPEERGEYDLVMGHMIFGAHEVLPAAQYITFLRNPVDRVVSHYYYVREKKDHYLREEILTKNYSLLDYVESGISTELNNGQVRSISGTVKSVEFGKCTETMLEQAWENIEKYFAGVGILEKFDESLILFRNTLGWKGWPYYMKRNITKSRSAVSDVPVKTIEAIKEYNRLDIELYNESMGKFNEKFNADINKNLRCLKRLKMLNKAYKIYQKPFVHRIVSLLRK